jgi:hypothetical protein
VTVKADGSSSNEFERAAGLSACHGRSGSRKKAKFRYSISLVQMQEPMSHYAKNSMLPRWKPLQASLPRDCSKTVGVSCSELSILGHNRRLHLFLPFWIEYTPVAIALF